MSIRETGFRRMDIILGEFQGQEQLGQGRPVFDIVRQDLELSGYFRVLDGLEVVRDWGDSGQVRAEMGGHRG